ncbi:adenylosuccinate lyase [Dichotomicrobium thermohalophilum]|uniref:Adenylosuccinate lyase n=1 Tax=Dichotomicrobium thermohalophilum TaxID=933063 RepID=A0A397QA39_9HYPH|nr:adenylosuccinate lyase [Dichotomicrobium thermohalophilum]RIA55111.1 adenylosuccinate lyase [Dichotomicrobium thermohalophilum]
MIPRYSRPEMAALWSPETRYQIWLEIETAATEAMAELGIVPEEAAKAVRERGGFDVARIDEVEREVRHDVIAFLTSLAEHVGPEARFVHQGLTSSDVLDTCLAVQLTRAADLLLADLDGLLDALRRRAFEHKMTPCIGRSHGIHAEPTTFGLKMAQAYAEFSRARTRLEAARADVATCAISGAVGTFANIDPQVEERVAQKLGLTPEPISTQVIPRDRHAMFFATLGVIASSVERLATEIRHLQRTEVGEAEEYFASGQKGSSAMPHKRNPVLTENLTGLARVVRGYVTPAMEDVALWHERDISHSSVERMIGPDATVTLDFALTRLTGVIDGLVVYPERMRQNLEATGGLVYSQQVLLALTKAGAARDDAYRMVQRNAMRAWHGEGGFKDNLLADAEVTAVLPPEMIDDLFSLDHHLAHVDTIFARVFGEA